MVTPLLEYYIILQTHAFHRLSCLLTVLVSFRVDGWRGRTGVWTLEFRNWISNPIHCCFLW